SLNLNDNLSTTRKKLNKLNKIKMNDMLSFAEKIHNNSLAELSEIARNDEEDFLLEEITEVTGKESRLYLVKSSPNWMYFNEKYKLDYGRTVSDVGIVEANERAFIMKCCKMADIGAEGCREAIIEFN